MSKIYVDEIAGKTTSDTVAIPGHIIQVTGGTFGDNEPSTSTSFADCKVFLELTASAANSKFVFNCGLGCQPNLNAAMKVKVVRRVSGQSDVDLTESRIQKGNNTNNGDADRHAAFSIYDSPNVAAGTTVQYRVQFATTTANNEVRVNDNSNTTATLMEVAG